MTPPSRAHVRIGVLLVVGTVLLATVPGVVLAQETRAGGTVVVEDGETVNGLDAFAGTVIVRGTVDGDLNAVAGSVLVDGTVTGDVAATAGNVEVDGVVDGSVEVASGSFSVGQNAEIGGGLEAAAGAVTVDGAVTGDVVAAADTIALGPSAVVGGDLRYAGDLRLAEGATVEGQTIRDDDLNLDVGYVGDVPTVPGWTGSIYGLLVNFVVGAVLLLAFPTFSGRVAARARDSPLRSGGIGLLALVGIPILLVLVALTVVGIPVSIAGAVLFGVLVWIALVYGQFAVGVWLLSYTDIDSPWAALAVGLLALWIVGFIPIFGGLVTFLVLILGLGAVLSNLRGSYQGRRRRRAEATREPRRRDTGTDSGTP